MDEMDRVTLVVGPKFWWDHEARDLVNHSGEDYVTRVGKTAITVSLHPFDVADLYSDAEHYSDPFTAAEMGDRGLAASARATMRSIEKVVDAETLKAWTEAWSEWERAQIKGGVR